MIRSEPVLWLRGYYPPSIGPGRAGFEAWKRIGDETEEPEEDWVFFSGDYYDEKTAREKLG